MPPIVAAAGITAAAGLVGSAINSRAQSSAARMEERGTNAALTDAREERSYDRMTAEEQRKYDRMTSEEQRAYDRARYADETGYERGRYAEERDYGRGVYAEERDYGRGQFANYQQRLAPFMNAGVGAVNKLGASVGRNTAAMVPTMGGGALVTIQAPNGQTKQVPEAHAQHYISKGGKVVS